jgi:hypothetical protein
VLCGRAKQRRTGEYMTEVRTSSLCERPCAGIEDTLEASVGTGGSNRPRSRDGACTGKRLAGKPHEPFERAGRGRAQCPTSPDSTAVKPANKAKEAHCGGICGGGRSGVGGANGGGQGEYAPAKHVLGSEPGSRDKGAGAYTATLPSHTRGGRSYGAGGGGCGTFIVHTNRWRLPRGASQRSQPKPSRV